MTSSVLRHRRGVWAGLALLLAGTLFFGVFPRLLAWRLNQQTSRLLPPMIAQSQSLHAKLLVVDLHAATLLWSRDLLARAGWGHVDLPRLTDGNVALQVFSAVTRLPWRRDGAGGRQGADLMTPLILAELWPPETWSSDLQRALYQAGELKRLVRRAGSRLIAIRSKADIDRLLIARSQAQANGLPPPVGVMLSVNGPGALEDRLGDLDALFDAGFRMAAPPQGFDARPGQGAAQGLTPIARQWLARMEAKGMVVDVAGTPEPVLHQLLVESRRPVVASHTGLRGTCDNSRNLSDDQARAIAATGGLIGIGYWRGAVCDVSIEAIVKAIRYAVALVGVDHVALGSNFDAGVQTPMDPAGLAHLTHGLTAAGFSDDDIAKLAGGNALRVLRDLLPP